MVAVAPVDTPQQSQAEGLVVVADPDRVSAMITARILEKMQLTVERVESATAALEVLKDRTADLLICEATLPDLPAATLISTAQRLYGAASLPVLITTMDLRSRLRLELLRAGATGCLAKPLEADELRLCVERSLTTARNDAHGSAAYLSGLIEHVSIPDVLTMAELARLSGHLEVTSRFQRGRVELDRGAIRHAVLGRLEGLEALGEILRAATGWFRLRPAATTGVATLQGSTTQVLLRATIEDSHRQMTRSSRPSTLERLGVSTAQADGATAEPARRAARLLPALGDPLRLGELELVTEDDRDPTTLTLFLFGDLLELVSAMWEISAPVSPRLLLDAQPGAKLRWRFHGRDRDRLLVRMIALDEPSPSWFDSQSDGVLVAAPATGVHAIDPAVRAYVQTHNLPTVIIAEPAEGARLFSPAAFFPIHLTGRRLSAMRGDMRSLLVTALRHRSQP